jgi:hypothetical protein
MKKKSADPQTAVNILINLLISKGEKCPPSVSEINEDLLLYLARQNKCLPYLFHFLDCQNCQKKVSPLFLAKMGQERKFTILTSLLYQKELEELGSFCCRQKIRAVVIKNFTPYPLVGLHQQYFLGSDIDLLVSPQSLPKLQKYLTNRGYQLSKHLKLSPLSYEEFNFQHPKNKTSFDIHTKIAIPLPDGLQQLTSKTVDRLSAEIINRSKIHNNGLYYPQDEDFLLILLIHFIGSDLMKGLRSLFDIIQFGQKYQHQLDWKKFFLQTQNLQIYRQTLFIFLLGSNFFNLPLPSPVSQLIKRNPWFKMISFLFSPKETALFPQANDWIKDNKEMRKISFENYLTRLILSDQQHPLRLLRPQILNFISQRLVEKSVELVTVKIKNLLNGNPFHIHSW